MLDASQETNLVVPGDPCSSHTAVGHVNKRQPAPLPGPAHARVEPLPLASLAWGLNWLYLLDHAKHQKGLSLGLASPKQPSEWA